MRLYLFDLDGTLVLTGGAGLRALNRMFKREYGFQEAMAQVSVAGKTDPRIVAEILQAQLGRDPHQGELERLFEIYLAYLPRELEGSQGFRILPGVKECLARLVGQGNEVGLATGNIREGARLKLEHADLWRQFAFGGFADDSDDRATLVKVAASRATGAYDGGDTYVVGDTPRDVAAAHANGFRAIAVATGPFSADELRKTGAEQVIGTLKALS